jgi:hypothetical protein
MNITSNSTPRITGLRGATVGGIVGITVWQILSVSLLGLGFYYGLAALVVYMALCFLLGVTIERVTLEQFNKRSDD